MDLVSLSVQHLIMKASLKREQHDIQTLSLKHWQAAALGWNLYYILDVRRAKLLWKCDRPDKQQIMALFYRYFVVPFLANLFSK